MRQTITEGGFTGQVKTGLMEVKRELSEICVIVHDWYFQVLETNLCEQQAETFLLKGEATAEQERMPTSMNLKKISVRITESESLFR